MGALGIAGLSFVAILLFFIFGVIIGGLFIWIAAKIARVENATFAKAILVSIASIFLIVILFILMPFLGHLLGFILGLILSILIIKTIFNTSFARSIIVWIFLLIAIAIAILLLSIIGISSIFIL